MNSKKINEINIWKEQKFPDYFTDNFLFAWLCKINLLNIFYYTVDFIWIFILLGNIQNSNFESHFWLGMYA